MGLELLCNVIINYSGELGARESQAAYQWLQSLIKTIGIDALHGEVFDFRGVTRFTTENLIDARRHSRTMNILMNTQNFPVALIVANAMHEGILRGPMRVVAGNTRKYIVYTDKDALAFIEAWHAQKAGAV